MTSDPWADMTARWREIYDQNAAAARKSWLDGQSQLSKTFAAGAKDSHGTDATALADLWRSWLTFGDSMWWAPSTNVGEAWPGAKALGTLTESLTMSLANGGAVSQALRRMADGPRLADVGAPEQRTAKVMERWLAVQEGARVYEGIVAAAWSSANSRFAEQLSQRAREGTAMPDAKESLKLWLDTANDVLLETHRSEKFLEAQRRLLRDGMEFMLAERELVEALVEPIGLPTRSEIDEVHQNVHELKRRVRSLEKQLAARALNQTTHVESSHVDTVPGGDQQ
jgi:polyhydroxyalkanoate synthesis regulator phasin